MLPRKMTGKQKINLKGGPNQVQDEDDVIMSSDSETNKDAIKINELDEINKKYQSDSSEEIIDTSTARKEHDNTDPTRDHSSCIPQKKHKNRKNGSEDEWDMILDSDPSHESDVSLVSDYVPDTIENRLPKAPRPPEPKSVLELIQHSKYKKLMKASKESYKQLNEGIENAGEDQKQEEKEGEGEGEGDKQSQTSISSASIAIEDLLPFSPPIYKCIRLPQHLKWVTIHHSTVSHIAYERYRK